MRRIVDMLVWVAVRGRELGLGGELLGLEQIVWSGLDGTRVLASMQIKRTDGAGFGAPIYWCFVGDLGGD